MDLRQLVILALKVSIVCTVVGFGLRAGKGDILYLLQRPNLLGRSLTAVLLIMPILAIVLVRAFDFPAVTEIALVALAISPLPPLLPGKQTKAGGRYDYGLALMALLGLLAIVTVPLSVEILERLFGRSLGAAPAAIARMVLPVVVLPLALGMGVRALTPALAKYLERPVAMAGTILMPLAALVLLAGTWRAVMSAASGGAVIAIVVFVAAGLLVGHLLGGREPDHALVLALATACRHPAIALSIASTNFADEHFAGTILLYLLVSAVVCAPYLAWQRRHSVATVLP